MSDHNLYTCQLLADPFFSKAALAAAGKAPEVCSLKEEAAGARRLDEEAAGAQVGCCCCLKEEAASAIKLEQPST